MGLAGRARVEERFSWTSVAARTEALYGDAIEAFRREARRE
jgi:glycosyltransferase involved in cell wall biosynthesis